MGVDTKAVVMTDQKDFWKVSQRIGNAIYNLIRPNYEAMSLKEKMTGSDQWKLPKIRIALESYHSLEYKPDEYFQFLFTYDGQERMLHCHTDCEGDLKECYGFGEGSKGIILSFGYWGSSVEIMEKILEQLKDMGKCYILEMDCDDNWREI